jgi:hypothetical protein
LSSQTDQRRRRDAFHQAQPAVQDLRHAADPSVGARVTRIDNKDKMTFISFDLKVCAGTGAGTPSYKKHMRTFDKGTPQEWMELLTGLRKIRQLSEPCS